VRERPQNNPAGCSAVVPLLHFTAAPKVRKSGRRGQFAAEAGNSHLAFSPAAASGARTALVAYQTLFGARIHTGGAVASERASEMENKFIRGKLGERCERVSARDVCEGPNFARLALAAKRQVERAGRQHYCRTPTGQRAALNLPDIATRALDLLMANNIATPSKSHRSQGNNIYCLPIDGWKKCLALMLLLPSTPLTIASNEMLLFLFS